MMMFNYNFREKKKLTFYCNRGPPTLRFSFIFLRKLGVKYLLQLQLRRSAQINGKYIEHVGHNIVKVHLVTVKIKVRLYALIIWQNLRLPTSR